MWRRRAMESQARSFYVWLLSPVPSLTVTATTYWLHLLRNQAFSMSTTGTGETPCHCCAVCAHQAHMRCSACLEVWYCSKGTSSSYGIHITCMLKRQCIIYSQNTNCLWVVTTRYRTKSDYLTDTGLEEACEALQDLSKTGRRETGSQRILRPLWQNRSSYEDSMLQ